MSNIKEPQLLELITALQTAADNAAVAGDLALSGLLCGARQTIRVLWTDLHPAQPTAAPPAEPPQEPAP